MQRDDAEREINVLKEKIGNLNLEILKQRNEIDRLNRELMLNKGAAIAQKPLIITEESKYSPNYFDK